MRYSVYNVAARKYDYYEDGRTEGTHAGAPPASSLGNVATGKVKIGAPPEASTWRLPWGAKKVGMGDMPQGRIASSGSLGLGELVELNIPLSAVIAVGLGYVAWKVIK